MCVRSYLTGDKRRITNPNRGGIEMDKQPMKVCMYVLIILVRVVVEGTKGAEAWQTAKRIKYRSTTKAVSQGRLSHKSPFDNPSSATPYL